MREPVAIVVRLVRAKRTGTGLFTCAAHKRKCVVALPVKVVTAASMEIITSAKFVKHLPDAIVSDGRPWRPAQGLVIACHSSEPQKDPPVKVIVKALQALQIVV